MANILKLSDLTPEERSRKRAWMEGNALYIDPAGKPYGFFQMDIDHLNEIGGQLILFPLEHIAEYATSDIKMAVDGKVNDLPFLGVPPDVEAADVSGLTATMLGDLAYITLHLEKSEAKEKAEQLLDKYYLYFKDTHEVNV